MMTFENLVMYKVTNGVLGSEHPHKQADFALNAMLKPSTITPELTAQEVASCVPRHD